MGNHFNIPKIRSRGRINWCGPYALAVIFGCSYDHAESFLKQVTRRKMIKGVWNDEMQDAIALRNTTLEKSYLRARVLPVNDHWATGRSSHNQKRLTMTQWYKQRRDRTATYLVQVTGHYLIVRGTKVIDAQSRAWQPFHARRKHKRSLVRNVWIVDRMAR